jgi:hypothetical protein
VRAFLSVPRDRAVDETRIRLQELSGPRPRLFSTPGRKPSTNTSACEASFQRRRCLLRTQIDGDGALAAIEAGVGGGLFTDGGRKGADGIAFARLDLDDVRAQVGEGHGRVRPRMWRVRSTTRRPARAPPRAAALIARGPSRSPVRRPRRRR